VCFFQYFNAGWVTEKAADTRKTFMEKVNEESQWDQLTQICLESILCKEK